jgi:hypothetical protein
VVSRLKFPLNRPEIDRFIAEIATWNREREEWVEGQEDKRRFDTFTLKFLR